MCKIGREIRGCRAKGGPMQKGQSPDQVAVLSCERDKGNHFQFDHHFTVKQTPENLKTFSEKYFTAKQTEPYIFPTTK